MTGDKRRYERCIMLTLSQHLGYMWIVNPQITPLSVHEPLGTRKERKENLFLFLMWLSDSEPEARLKIGNFEQKKLTRKHDGLSTLLAMSLVVKDLQHFRYIIILTYT